METGTGTAVSRDEPRVALRVAVVAGFLAPATAGCSSSTAQGHSSAAAPPSTSVASSGAATPAASSYVAQVEALCGELPGKVLAVYGGQGHHTTYPIRVYLA